MKMAAAKKKKRFTLHTTTNKCGANTCDYDVSVCVRDTNDKIDFSLVNGYRIL